MILPLLISTLLNKILILILFMSILNLVKHVWNIFMVLRNEDVPNKYELSKREFIFLGLSVAYILTTIFTGIKL
jgi:hypothetical protein